MAGAGGNPRKFSEKIALHNQKQAEETAAFEQIMKEVKNVSTTPGAGPQTPKTKQSQLIPIAGSTNCRSLPNVHQMSQHDKGPQSGHFNPKMSSPRASRGSSIGPVKNHHRARTDTSPYGYACSPPSLSNLSNISSSMNAGNFSGSNLHSAMMHPSYLLSPPSDVPRRANSDSALHSQSSHSLIIPSVVPDSSEESSNNSNDPRDNYGYAGMGHYHKLNDPSLIPNTVGDGHSLLEIPTSVSTGSLPDLTNFQFTPPLQQPIDPEDSQLTNSPYSTSPLSMTYSPTGGSPNPPPHSNNPQQHQGVNNQRSPHHGPPLHVHLPQHQQQQHASQHNQQQSLQNSQSQQQNMIDNALSMNSNFPNFNQTDNNMLNAYRCPQRPSPQSSPSPFRSPSPLDGQLSAPASPSATPQMQNSADSYFLSQQANALQQHFEQFSMGSPAPHRINGSNWQGGGMVNSFFYQSGHQTGATAGITTQQSPHHQPQTPQTPTSIPDIIFTDFSDVRSGPFDDLLAAEAAAQALREGLGSLDMDGFNMLADPDLVPLDPQAEDSFRLDRLD